VQIQWTCSEGKNGGLIIVQHSRRYFYFILSIRPGVCNLRPTDRMWPSTTFYAAHHMIWELVNARKAKKLSVIEENIDLYIHTHYLSVRANNRKKKN
jgi:hypothetical protein